MTDLGLTALSSSVAPKWVNSFSRFCLKESASGGASGVGNCAARRDGRCNIPKFVAKLVISLPLKDFEVGFVISKKGCIETVLP